MPLSSANRRGHLEMPVLPGEMTPKVYIHALTLSFISRGDVIRKALSPATVPLVANSSCESARILRVTFKAVVGQFINWRKMTGEGRRPWAPRPLINGGRVRKKT